MSYPHPHPRPKWGSLTKTRRMSNIAMLSSWSLSILIATQVLGVSAEIKFIPVNRGQSGVRDNILEESGQPLQLPLPHPHSNKVHRPHEPLALESAVVATVHLSPSLSSNGTGGNDDKPNINSSPVLQFHTPAEETEEDSSDYDDDDEGEGEESEGGDQRQIHAKEETVSDAVDRLLKSDSLLGDKLPEDEDVTGDEVIDSDDDDVQSLTPTTRHRRRLMLLRSRNILVPETSTSSSSSVSSTTSSSKSASSSLRPPKEHIIYALPEQSFWAKTKRGGGRKGGKNSKVPATPHLDEDGVTGGGTETPLAGSDQTVEQVTQEDGVNVNLGVFNDPPRHNDYINVTPPSTPNFYHVAQTYPPRPEVASTPTSTSTSTSLPTPQFYHQSPHTGGDSSINFQQFLTTPPPPTTVSTSTSTVASTSTPTTATPSTTTPKPTPSPAETLRMTLAEKKFHLGQCMRYCMDAIL